MASSSSQESQANDKSEKILIVETNKTDSLALHHEESSLEGLLAKPFNPLDHTSLLSKFENDFQKDSDFETGQDHAR